MRQDQDASQPDRMYSPEADFLVFAAGETQFALPSFFVHSIIDKPRPTRMPMSGEAIRGVIDFPGGAIPLYDMRRKVGLPLLAEEVEGAIELLGKRKQDHLSWIENLKRSVAENGKVTVETDP
nr:chemotaxis protein CheW [Desulfobacteraceae bacterium]